MDIVSKLLPALSKFKCCSLVGLDIKGLSAAEDIKASISGVDFRDDLPLIIIKGSCMAAKDSKKPNKVRKIYCDSSCDWK